MAKAQIKSEKLTPFGGIFPIMERFGALLGKTIDSTLGLRCTSFGYQYREIIRSLQVDQDIKAVCAKYLFRKQRLCKCVSE